MLIGGCILPTQCLIWLLTSLVSPKGRVNRQCVEDIEERSVMVDINESVGRSIGHVIACCLERERGALLSLSTGTEG